MDNYDDLAICSSKKKNGAVIRGSKPHDKGCTVTPLTNAQFLRTEIMVILALIL